RRDGHREPESHGRTRLDLLPASRSGAPVAGTSVPQRACAVSALGILFARPDVGLMRRVMADDGGGLLIRRMLPIAILLPIVLGWLRIAGQELGLFGNEFGRILLILSFILAFSGLIWWMGGVLAQRSPGRHESA